MADSASESDASSMDVPKESLATSERLLRRLESLTQENRVLKTEVETLKLKIKGLNEMNHQLRRNSVNIQAKAEQEEEYISNTLLKKITELKKEKESLAINYEQEEECLTNELNRKFTQLRQEKVALEQTLAREQENQVSKLMRRIEKLEADMNNKQDCLERLRREKIELENALEQEQEALVNRLWKKMEKLETEKRELQEKLESVGGHLSGGNSLLGESSGLLPVSTSVHISRPISSGPESLRGSFRQNPSAPCTTSTGPGSLTSLSSQFSPGRVRTSTSDCKISQFNQSSSAVNESSVSKPQTVDAEGFGNTVLPPSPMEVDAHDQVCGDAPSPAGNIDPSTQLTSVNRSIRTPSTLCASSKNPVNQGSNASNLASDATTGSNTRVISSFYVNRLRDEVCRLRQLLQRYEAESATKMPQFESEERSVAEENRRLRKLLQVEKERREALSRQLSESESSLEMEDERQFNEASRSTRLRTTSDSNSSFQNTGSTTLPFAPNSSSVAYGPGHAFAAAVAAGVAIHSGSNRFCRECGQSISSGNASLGRTPSLQITSYPILTRTRPDRPCSPMVDLSTSIGHQANLPTSPATPTTASIAGDHFVKPTYPCTFNPSTHLTQYYMNNVSSVADTNFGPCYSEKRLSSYSIDTRESQKSIDNEDIYDEDDARCVTPPSSHSGFTYSEK